MNSDLRGDAAHRRDSVGTVSPVKDAGDLLAHGNQRAGWDAGQRFDHPNPEYRQVPDGLSP